VCRHESIFEKKAIDQTIDYRLKSAQFWKAYLVRVTGSGQHNRVVLDTKRSPSGGPLSAVIAMDLYGQVPSVTLYGCCDAAIIEYC
jgi:hypothetical protein